MSTEKIISRQVFKNLKQKCFKDEITKNQKRFIKWLCDMKHQNLAETERIYNAMQLVS